MTRHTRIEIENPRHLSLGEVVAVIGAQIARGETEGYARDGEESVRWEIEGAKPTAAVDRRQRLAAAALVMGFDLPEPMATAAVSMGEAARILPGMTTADLPALSPNMRRNCLEFARGLIDEMLAETPDPAKG